MKHVTIRADTENTEAIAVKKSYLHSGYIGGYYYNDIALYELGNA